LRSGLSQGVRNSASRARPMVGRLTRENLRWI
jgi:hypothetical protein